MKKEYDIFISYRRDGGESTAKILRDKLTELGYSVFFDVESLRSGDFNTRLYSVIEECDDVLVVLSPGALDRCINEDDWVRLEIEHALEKGKNIVPVMLRGFAFPEKLPDSIDGLRYKNGLESNYQFFDAFIEKLQEFLTAKPSNAGILTPFMSRKRKNRLPMLIAGALVLLLIAFLLFRAFSSEKPYPSTEDELNLTGRFTYYVQTNLMQLEAAAGYMDEAYRECETYLKHFDDSSEGSVLAALSNARLLIYGMDNESAAMPEDLRVELQDSPFSAADAEAMHDYLLLFCDSSIDDLYYMEYIVSKDTYMDLEVREEILESYRDIMDEELRYTGYCINEMFLPVENEEAISSFKYDFLPELYYIPLRASEWNDSQKALESAQESSMTAIMKSDERIKLTIGEGNMEVMQQKAELAEQYMELGMSAEEAEARVDHIVGQADMIAAAEAELADTKQKLEEKYAEAREKYAPLDTDDPDTLWGKMMRFITLGMYDEAADCVHMLREKTRDTDPWAEEYTAAMINFLNNVAETGIDYGLMVVGYDPSGPEHEQYKIGDVIISINGGICRNYEEYQACREQIPEGEGYQAVVLRSKDDGSGELEQKELSIPGDAPRVQLRDIKENPES